MKKYLFLILFAALLPLASNRAAFPLVKTPDSPTVYFIDSSGIRHAFPDFATYQSWYGHDFSRVATLSKDFIARHPLGKNITMRPGKHLVKIPSDPKVYAVEQGGVLRHIDNYEIAENLYGKQWEKKLVDIPEVFFGDYQVGQPLTRSNQIPDGVVYQIRGQGTLYWKEREILQPFASWDDMMANGFAANDIVSNDFTYYKRKKPISGTDKSVFNPVAMPYRDTSDCEARDIKAAFIFLSQGDFPKAEVEKIEMIREKLEERYAWATQELARLDASWPTMLLTDDGYMVLSNELGQNDLTNEVGFSFYENNPDIFDYLIIFTNFQVFYDETLAHYISASNHVDGIGKTQRRGAHTFGSDGKLKGIVNMGDIKQYSIAPERELSHVLNLMVHELGHWWGAEVQFLDENGEHSQALLSGDDHKHWSSVVSWASPLGGHGWMDNGDGTFTSWLSQAKDPYARPLGQFDLYLAGLLPAQVIKPQMYVAPENPEDIGNTIRGQARYVNIEQIIKANGKRHCTK